MEGSGETGSDGQRPERSRKLWLGLGPSKGTENARVKGVDGREQTGGGA